MCPQFVSQARLGRSWEPTDAAGSAAGLQTHPLQPGFAAFCSPGTRFECSRGIFLPPAFQKPLQVQLPRRSLEGSGPNPSKKKWLPPGSCRHSSTRAAEKHILCCPWSHSLDFPPSWSSSGAPSPCAGLQAGRAALKSNEGLAVQDGNAELGFSYSWRGDLSSGNDASPQLQHQLGSGLILPSLPGVSSTNAERSWARRGPSFPQVPAGKCCEGTGTAPPRQGIPFSPDKALLCPFPRWNFREFPLLECPEEGRGW